MNNAENELQISSLALLVALNKHYIDSIATLTGKSKQEIADEIEAIRQAIIAQSKQEINQMYPQSSQAATDVPPDVSEKD